MRLTIEIKGTPTEAVKVAGRVLLGTLLALPFLTLAAAFWFIFCAAEASGVPRPWGEIGALFMVVFCGSGMCLFAVAACVREAAKLWR